MIKRNKTLLRNIDWYIVLLYVFMTSFGGMNLYSVSTEKAEKQLIWILLSLIFIFIVFLFKPIHYKYFSPYFFLFTLILLIGVFFLGKNVNGSKSWYVFGPISFQPSELSKISTSLMIAHLMSQEDFQKNKKILLYIFIILILPAVLILLQPDPGSAIVFSSFILTLYREGLSIFFIFYAFILIFLFILSLNISPWILTSLLFLIL
ncbi:rod shape-determining protein RodA, partial [Blattabacterium cuenoti]|uniref:rod shape-determining protein RodA n=1 Tax=Blattabacterium cuenoti TaxID=1653831 RepID=UPI00163D39E8